MILHGERPNPSKRLPHRHLKHQAQVQLVSDSQPSAQLESRFIQTTCAPTSASQQQNNHEIASHSPALPASHLIRTSYQRHLDCQSQTQLEIGVHPSDYHLLISSNLLTYPGSRSYSSYRNNLNCFYSCNLSDPKISATHHNMILGCCDECDPIVFKMVSQSRASLVLSHGY